jgi:hypothetical protein
VIAVASPSWSMRAGGTDTDAEQPGRDGGDKRSPPPPGYGRRGGRGQGCGEIGSNVAVVGLDAVQDRLVGGRGCGVVDHGRLVTGNGFGRVHRDRLVAGGGCLVVHRGPPREGSGVLDPMVGATGETAVGRSCEFGESALRRATAPAA